MSLDLKNLLFKEEWTGSTKQHIPIYWTLLIETPVESSDSIKFVCFNQTLHCLFFGYPCFSQDISESQFFSFFNKRNSFFYLNKVFGWDQYYVKKDGTKHLNYCYYAVKKCWMTMIKVLCRSGLGKIKDNAFEPFFLNNPEIDHEELYLRKMFDYFKKGAITFDEFEKTDFYLKPITKVREYPYLTDTDEHDPLVEKFIYRERFVTVKEPVQLTDELLDQYLNPRKTYRD